MRRADPNRQLLSEPEAAELMEISPRTLRRMCARGRGPARFLQPRPGGGSPSPMYDRAEVLAMRPQSAAQVMRPGDSQMVATAAPAGPSLLAAALDRLTMAVMVHSAAAPLALAPPREWLTPGEAGLELGLSEAFLRRAIRAGNLPVVRDGHRYKVARVHLVSLVNLSKCATELRGLVAERRAARG